MVSKTGEIFDMLRRWLPNPAAVAFASDCAAYVVGKEALSRKSITSHREALAGHEAGHVVVMAALGIHPKRVTLSVGKRRGSWKGLVEPVPTEIRPVSLEEIGRSMCMLLAGYMGERRKGIEQFSTSAHEMGMAFYFAKYAELLFPGVTARAAIRGALSYCQRILEGNADQFSRTVALLVERADAERSDLDETLAGLAPCDLADFGTLVRQGGGLQAYPEIESALPVAHALAGAVDYADHIGQQERRPLAAIAEISSAGFLFSGGKESIVLAHMLKPWRDRVTMLWVNTGAMFPHMGEFVRRFAERSGFNFVELHSNQAARFARVGLPTKVIPIMNTVAGQVVGDQKPRLMVCDELSCCAELRGQPAFEWMRLNGVKALIHGQREADQVRPQLAGAVEIAPLWEWTEAQVYDYIRDNGLELPEQYAAGYRDSGECWNCTADVMKPERFTWMRSRYPELLRQLVPAIAEVYGVVSDRLEEMRPGFRAAVTGFNELTAHCRKQNEPITTQPN